MIVSDLERRINKQRTFTRSFTPGAKNAESEKDADIAQQLAHLYSVAVSGGDNLSESISTVLRELVSNAFAYAHGEHVEMEMHIGPKGVMITYTDTGGFYQMLEIEALFGHFKGEGGLARIAKAAEVDVDLMNGVLRCSVYGSLSLRQTRQHELAKSAR